MTRQDETNPSDLPEAQKPGAAERRGDGARDAAPEPPAKWDPDAHPSAESPEGIHPFVFHDEQPRDETRDSGEPANYRQDKLGVIGKATMHLSDGEAALFESGRKYISIAQACAVISLFFGGIVLSGFALAMAVMGYVKLNRIVSAKADNDDMRRALLRSGILAIALCLLTLGVNAISVILYYPILMQMLQSGDLGSMLQGATGTPTSNSTWG